MPQDFFDIEYYIEFNNWRTSNSKWLCNVLENFKNIFLTTHMRSIFVHILIFMRHEILKLWSTEDIKNFRGISRDRQLFVYHLMFGGTIANLEASLVRSLTIKFDYKIKWLSSRVLKMFTLFFKNIFIKSIYVLILA